jgi:hypothetical protein
VLEGHCNNFLSSKSFVDFGRAHFIQPSAEFPGLRLRFTPAAGLIYGPKPRKRAKQATRNQTKPARPFPTEDDPLIPDGRAIYNTRKGIWCGFGFSDKDVKNETVPPSLFAIDPPAPSWLYDNEAVSRGYFDDACDGFVEVRLTLADNTTLEASARICAGPPALVPDSLFVRCLADDLEQVIHGPKVDTAEDISVTRQRAMDIVRRAYETVRFMNVAVMNGNDFKGRSSLTLDSMPQEEAADTERAIRPIMAPGTVDTLAIMALHEQVFAALRGGAAPWFEQLLRLPEEAADLTDRGRRKMPALMCGADNNYLALTYRQIDTIRRVATEPATAPAAPPPAPAKLTPRNLTAQLHYEALGNPPSSRPAAAVANCCPGLEVDFRAVWRRIFKGIELREHDNLVVHVDDDCPHKEVKRGQRLLRVFLGEDDKIGIPLMGELRGPASSDPDGSILLTTDLNPHGLAPLEWSNALARVLSGWQGKRVHCVFTKRPVWEKQEAWNPKREPEKLAFEVRHFFEPESAVISRELAAAGELTQGLCSPWQNDYRECSCYYWASARPDYVNVEVTPSGLSNGDNWLQKQRTGDYVPDDYKDLRLINYDDLFAQWERWLRFQVGGRDVADDAPKSKA